MSTTYTLTPADLALLRASVHVRCSDGTFAAAVPPFICLGLTGTWELHAYGKVQARHGSLEPVAACLQRELAEPGWIAYALSPAADPEEACLGGYERQQRETARATSAALAAQRKAAAEDAEWRVRRLQQFDPTAITLDDLE